MSRSRSKPTPSERPRRGHQKTGVPVVLPHVVMDVTAVGMMTVTVDGNPYLPEPFAPPRGRENCARILDQLTDQYHAPVRVEVREADGSVFTDIITPDKRRRPDPEPGASTQAAPKLLGPLVLPGERFVPGEELAVAVAVVHATRDCTTRGVLTPKPLAARSTREAISLGCVSGVLSVGHPE